MGWVGGKRLLRRRIIEKMPPNKTYVEVFGGAGWVLFGKPPSKVEVYNDLNSDLVNLFRAVRNNLDAFKNRMYFLLSSREEYYVFQKVLKTGEFKNDIDRAIAFYYCLKNSFGSGVFTGWGFSPVPPPRSCITEDLELARERLAKIYIDNLPFERLIANWDRPDTLFYLDPPYCMLLSKGGRSYYDCTFTDEDHVRLRNKLNDIRGKFILSYDNDPVIKELYKGFNIEETDPVLYTMNRKVGTPSRRMVELIITNY